MFDLHVDYKKGRVVQVLKRLLHVRGAAGSILQERSNNFYWTKLLESAIIS